MALNITLILLVARLFSISCNAINSSSVLLAASGPNDYTTWASNYKKSEKKLNSLLAKCFECITEFHDEKLEYKCTNNTGMNTITKDGVIITSNAFLSGASGSLKNAYDYNSWPGSGSASASEAYTDSTSWNQRYKSRQQGTSLMYQKSGYDYKNVTSSFQNSLTCMVGPIDQAVPIPCEYGNGYCQVAAILTGVIYFSCTPLCLPGEFNLCTVGTLSNKLGPICLVGSLASGSLGAKPLMCFLGEACQNVETMLDIVGSCSPFCQNSESEGVSCFYTDYGNRKGPLCYVGTFGENAVLLGCGSTDSCALSTADMTTIGQCVPICKPEYSICTDVDLGNRQGPICFVGQFGDNAVATACLTGQKCQRTTEYTELSTTITFGFCSSNCVSSATVFCCSTDLCNAYPNEFKQEYINHDRGYPIIASGTINANGGDHSSAYSSNMFGIMSQNKFNFNPKPY